jgi:hypothetical protein
MPEMNRKIGKFAKEEIINAMRGLSGSACKAEAERLANLHQVCLDRIYTITKHVRPKERKTRSDKGKRSFDLTKGDTWEAFKSMVADKFDAKQALEDAKINGFSNLPSLPTFRRLLSENQVTTKHQRIGKRAYRPFECEDAGDTYQVDVTGLKEGIWLDKKSRKVLKIPHTQINYNHPNANEQLTKVWQIGLVDDRTRRRFVRYVAKHKLESDDIVSFLVEAFAEFGLPKRLYTDNGGEFMGRCKIAEKLLNIITAEKGGYEHIRHAPGNAQATGKVESSHKWVEACDKFIGKMLRIGRGDEITIDFLNNNFAKKMCLDYNVNHVNGTTGQTPMERWDSSKVVSRIIEPTVLRSALLSDVFDSKLDEALTISFKKKIYQIPRDVEFQQYIGQNVSVVVPPDIDLILLTFADKSEYQIIKEIAKPDISGEFKKLGETPAQKLVKKAKEEIKAETKLMKSGEMPKARVKYFDTEVEVVKTNITAFPQKREEIKVDDIQKAIPVACILTSEPEFTYWQAYREFKSAFSTANECKEFLASIYQNEEEKLLKSFVKNAIDNRTRRSLLKVV